MDWECKKTINKEETKQKNPRNINMKHLMANKKPNRIHPYPPITKMHETKVEKKPIRGR